MYTLANNVLGKLKYDITGAAVSLVVEPIAGTPFSLPPAPTSAAGLTYGEPWGVVTLIDRLDSSAAKIEHILYNARAAETGGAYTLSGLVRGQEGSAAQAWTAGAYVMQQATDEVLAQKTPLAILRADLLLVHKRDAVLKWDGAAFTFDTFAVYGAGRGRHAATDGFFTITMPANTTVVTGFGGAANQTVAAGAIPIAAKHALYYEANIGGAGATVAGNFKLVATTADFVVPPHWILLAVHAEVVAGDMCLRVANGATLYPWIVVGSAGAPAFEGTWVNFGAPQETCAFFKDANQMVHLKGLAKSGTISTNIFVLPVGFRPAEKRYCATGSNAAFGLLELGLAGGVTASVGNNASFSLDVPPFLATV